MIPARMLAARPQVVWEDLEPHGAIVITEDGLPRSIMVPTSGATLLEDIQDIVYARARRAVLEIRAQARAASGNVTSADIEVETREVRRTRSRQDGR